MNREPATTRHFLQTIWLGVAIFIAGRLWDLRWHLTNDEFEGTTQQLEAHWLVWLGVVITFVAVATAVARLPREKRNAGFLVVLAGCATYVPVAVWHFIEHANGADPAVAHVLLGISDVVIIAGAILATFLARRAAKSRIAPAA